jgi:predicted nucleotidyltransferase
MAVSKKQLDRIVELAKSYGAKRLIIFGSAAKALSKARDIDIACDGIHGWKLYELAARLEDEMGAVFDVIPLSPPTPFTKYIESKGKILL